MQYSHIIALLKDNIDLKYKDFFDKLVPGGMFSYGVRFSVLRAIATQILSDKPEQFLRDYQPDSQEERMLYGMVLDKINLPFPKKLTLINAYLPHINNWAITDHAAKFKCFAQHRAEAFAFLLDFTTSEQEFYQRFAIVNLMANFMHDDYIDKVLAIYQTIATKDYYAQMGLAWALQIAYVKYKTKTENVLRQQVFPALVQNMAIQKIRESNSVSLPDKEKVTSYKIMTKATSRPLRR